MPKYAYKIFNFIFLIVIFGIFKNTPFYLIDKFLDVFTAFFCFFYLTHSFFVKLNEYYTIARKVIIGFLIIFVLSIIVSKMQYKQSLVDALAAQIDYLQIFVMAFYAYAFDKRKINPQSFEKYLKYFIFLNIIILVAFRNYIGSGTSVIGSHALTFKANYLPMQFIRFGVIYFFVMFLKKGKYIHGFIAVFLLFFPNILIHFERGYFVYTILIMMLTVMLIRKSKKFFSKLIIGTFILLVTLIVAFSFSGSFGSNILTKYEDIISGINQGSSEDASVNYRLKEIVAGFKLFAKDPLLGSGRLKSENSQVITGIDFYPSDLGVIGILCTYGVVGLIVFFAIFYLAIKTFRRTLRNDKIYSVLTLSLGIYFLGVCIESIQTAVAIIVPAFWSFIYIFYLYCRNLDTEKYLYLTRQYEDAVYVEEVDPDKLIA